MTINTVTIWMVLAYMLAALVDVTSGYTCYYYDRYAHLRYVYCGYGVGCCGTSSYRYCCDSYSVGSIVGGVFGAIFLIAIVVAIISCCLCNCCPYYQYRTSRGTIISPLIVESTPNYSSTVIVESDSPSFD